jgi:hypothetical protein
MRAERTVLVPWVVLAALIWGAGCSGKSGEGEEVAAPSEVVETSGEGTRLADLRGETEVGSVDAGEDSWYDFFVPYDTAEEVYKPDIVWNPGKDVPPEETGEEPSVKVKDLQSSPDSLNCTVLYGAMLVGMDIQLEQVVVTAPGYPFQAVPEKLTGFYIADAEGGKYSGIHASYPAAKIPDLKPGMVLTMVGDHKESYCFSLFVGKSLLIENEAGPAPAMFDTTPEEIMADPEAVEGVLVRIQSVTVTSANPDAADGLDNHEFEVNGVLRVGNDYGLAYMNPISDARKVGDQFAWIIGVMKFAGGKWHLMPRFNSDMLKEGEQPPEELQPEVVEVVEDVVDPVDIVDPDVVEVVDPDVVEDVPEDVPTDVPVEVAPDVPDIQPDIPATPDSPVVITEIQYDPEGLPDDKGEWVELFNAGEDIVDLNGWRLEDGKGQMHIIQYGGPFNLKPGELLVLGCNAIESTNGGVAVDYLYPYADFSLHNTADAVILKDLWGQVVDTVEYDEQAGWPAAKGASLSVLHPNLDNSNSASWKVSASSYGDGTNKGTPGTSSW